MTGHFDASWKAHARFVLGGLVFLSLVVVTLLLPRGNRLELIGQAGLATLWAALLVATVVWRIGFPTRIELDEAGIEAISLRSAERLRWDEVESIATPPSHEGTIMLGGRGRRIEVSCALYRASESLRHAIYAHLDEHRDKRAERPEPSAYRTIGAQNGTVIAGAIAAVTLGGVVLAVALEGWLEAGPAAIFGLPLAALFAAGALYSGSYRVALTETGLTESSRFHRREIPFDSIVRIRLGSSATKLGVVETCQIVTKNGSKTYTSMLEDYPLLVRALVRRSRASVVDERIQEGQAWR